MNESSEGSTCNIPKEWFEDDDQYDILDSDSSNSLKSSFDCTADEFDRYKKDDFDENSNERNEVTRNQQTLFDIGLVEGSTFDSHSELESHILHWGKNIGIVDLSADTARKQKKMLK